MTIVTDEMVEKSIQAFNDQTVAWNAGAVPQDAMRAALEAVAPALIAEGMREAFSVAFDAAGDLSAILARAQEIDPK